MDSAERVVFVLEVVLALGPLAVYFLGLGLVSSQGRPCLLGERADFVMLAIAVVPVVIVPVAGLVDSGRLWLAGGVAVGVAGLFLAMVPARGAGWVVYHVDARQCRRLVERACRRLGWSIQEGEDGLRVSPDDLIISQDALPWLGNVTIHLRGSAGGHGGAAARAAFARALLEESHRESLLPSPAGASLVVIGAALLGVPMWYMCRHMDAIVDVVRQILFA